MAELKKYRVTLPSGRETVLKLSEENRARNFPDAVPAGGPKPQKRATRAKRNQKAAAPKAAAAPAESKEKTPENKARTPEDK